MSKYEIMLVIDGTLNQADAKGTVDELKSLLKETKNLETTEMGLRDLAYVINKKNKGFYYVLNFETEKASIIAEFRRVTLLNKNVLRHLIINLEKDYGYKETINPKKIAKAEFKRKKYQAKKELEFQEREKIKKEKDTSSVKLTDI